MTNNSIPLVIYHGTGCLDGFGSAYAAYCYFSKKKGIEAEYLAAGHGDPLTVDVTGRDIYIVDFSYKRAILSEICESANKVVILDHHISAQVDLEGLEASHQNLEVVFDMTRSGAVITWEYFHEEPVPPLLAHIQDRDLWQFKIPESQHVNAGLMSYPYDFELWDGFAKNNDSLNTLIVEGRAINRFRSKMIETYKKKAVFGKIAGYTVPIVSCPGVITSELLGELAVGHPFAASYSDKVDRRGWSLRSTKEGLNVADIAAQFGGGGHPNAAGFATTISEQVFVVIPEK